MTTRRPSPTQSGPQLAAPQPGRAGGNFGPAFRGRTPQPQSDNETFGQNSSFETASIRQATQRQQQSSFSSQTRIIHEEGATTVTESSSFDVDKYLARESANNNKTLTDCSIRLEEGSLLIIEWDSVDDVDPGKSILELDEFIGVVGRRFVWGAAGGFRHSYPNVFLNGTALSHPDMEALRLEEHIMYRRGEGFVAIPPDPEFSKFLSSAEWMNFTVVTQPDIGAFFKSKPFQIAVQRVAQRSIDEVMKETQFALEKVMKETMEKIRVMSSEHIQREMNALIMTAAISAAYSGLGRLTMMQANQIQLYESWLAGIRLPPADSPDGYYQGPGPAFGQ